MRLLFALSPAVSSPCLTRVDIRLPGHSQQRQQRSGDRANRIDQHVSPFHSATVGQMLALFNQETEEDCSRKGSDPCRP